MQNDENSSTSGVPNPLDFNTSSQFSFHEELPSKGYCRLFKAQRYGKWYVLKCLRAEYIADPVYMAMLEKEFDSAVTLDHPNIVHTFSLETDEVAGRCFVMEYIEGRTLAQFLDENPSVAKRKQVVLQLLDAMEYFHARQIVHRDLKPSNILVTYNGDNVKVIDFGLADTDDYAVLKEPAYTKGYAAPEQMTAGSSVDCRTDIYAFGILLRKLFPHRYKSVARRCTNTLPARRYPSASAVRKAIIGCDNVYLYVGMGLSIALIAFFIAILPINISNTNIPIKRHAPAKVLAVNDSTTIDSDSVFVPLSPNSSDIKYSTSNDITVTKREASDETMREILNNAKKHLEVTSDSLYTLWSSSLINGKFSTYAQAQLSQAYLDMVLHERLCHVVMTINTNSIEQYSVCWQFLYSVCEDFRYNTNKLLTESDLPQPYNQYADPRCSILSDSIKCASERYRRLAQICNKKHTENLLP